MTPELDTISVCDALTFMIALEASSVDLIVTSPPYDALRVYGGNWSFDFENIARQSYRVLADGGVMVWVVGDSVVKGSETLNSMRQALYFVDEVGYRMHDTMVYQKDMTFPDATRYYSAWEYMFVLSKGAPKTHNLLTQKARYAGKPVSGTQRNEDGTRTKMHGDAAKKIRKSESVLPNVWYISQGYMKGTTDKEAYLHPAMFPEELARRHILTWTNPGEIVLDFFSGSGTTAKMARNLDRHYLACDVNPDYVDLARRRLAATDPYQDTPLPDGGKQLSLFGENLK